MHQDFYFDLYFFVLPSLRLFRAARSFHGIKYKKMGRQIADPFLFQV